MSRPRALDLFCCAGGVSVGLQRAGFNVVGVDIRPQPHYRGGTFVQADALTYPLEGFDFIWASPPCQAFSALRSLHKGKAYPDLIDVTRERLLAAGGPWCIENVEGAPLGSTGFLTVLCGTMFGLQTPDGRAELRRHRLFETSFSIPLRPACQHGGETLSVTGHSYHTDGARKRKRAISVVGGSAESKRTGWTGRGDGARADLRETFSIDDARAAMGIDWMPMKCLSQAIPPAYAEWIGRQALDFLGSRPLTP